MQQRKCSPPINTVDRIRGTHHHHRLFAKPAIALHRQSRHEWHQCCHKVYEATPERRHTYGECCCRSRDGLFKVPQNLQGIYRLRSSPILPSSQNGARQGLPAQHRPLMQRDILPPRLRFSTIFQQDVPPL